MSGDELFELSSAPSSRRVFVNRNLRFDSIKAVGFDMDYTLARYHRAAIEGLVFGLTIEKLRGLGYPEQITNFVYDPNFVIRGLAIDKKLGNVMKLDRHNHVAQVYHGKQRLTKSERRQLYRRRKVRFEAPRFTFLDTYFELPEIAIFADLIELQEQTGKPYLDPWQMFEDTRSCIDAVHRDGSLKQIVRADLATYIERDALLGPMLHKMRSAGKKLFLLTNSEWSYTDAVMSFLLGNGSKDYASWRRYFDGIVVHASKPGFWTGREPLTEIDSKGLPVMRGANVIKRDAAYSGGNVDDFEQAFQLAGEEILYIGDHIYGDILRSKRTAMWRTALVIEELELELETTARHAAEFEQRTALEYERRQLDDFISQVRATPKSNRTPIANTQRSEAQKDLQKVNRQLNKLKDKLQEHFNPYWGRAFKHNQENSRFGQQVTRHACLYTSRVTNFFYYSNLQYFRSPQDLMPHEHPDQ